MSERLEMASRRPFATHWRISAMEIYIEKFYENSSKKSKPDMVFLDQCIER